MEVAFWLLTQQPRFDFRHSPNNFLWNFLCRWDLLAQDLSPSIAAPLTTQLCTTASPTFIYFSLTVFLKLELSFTVFAIFSGREQVLRAVETFVVTRPQLDAAAVGERVA